MAGRDDRSAIAGRKAGSVCGRAGRVPSPEFSRSRRGHRTRDRRAGFRAQARTTSVALLHQPESHLGRYDLTGDAGIRARRPHDHWRPPRYQSCGGSDGRSAAPRRPGAGRRGAQRELETPAGARSRHAYGRDGAVGAGGRGGRRAGREGGRCWCRRLDVLHYEKRCADGSRCSYSDGCPGVARRVGDGRGAIVVTAEELAARRDVVTGSSDLQALLSHLRERAQPVLERMPQIPEQKALLSTDGGVCPDDGTALIFDPWSPTEHRCPRCDKRWRGERHDRHWARFQHLWLAERAVHLATVAALGDKNDCAAAKRAGEILTGYAERYWRYPNRDNLLGPSRLFFSTYIESIWTSNYLAAAMMLRAADLLDESTTKAVNQLIEEAATLIGDYDEGFSNRQTWNNAALTAVAVWFEDEELARRAIEGDTGLIAHLVRGYGRDGMWYEGENYHLFALRGLLTGTAWARFAGIDFWSEQRLAPRMDAALRAPTLTALPDFTFPARKDARFGVSLAQPAFLELWEVGLGNMVSREPDAVGGNELASWLGALHRVPPPAPELLESYLHDFGAPRPAHGGRRTLSWWSLLEMVPELPPVEQPWQPESVLLESQGLAVLRRGDRYVSLETGSSTAGHGHPDQLHLTVHANGVHWLPDPGTGRYVTRDLFWYRSVLAHTAPRPDGAGLADEPRCG